MMRVRCAGCQRIRVQFRTPGLCRRCHFEQMPTWERMEVNGRIAIVDGRWAARKRGQRKGNAAMRAKGKVHCWTSEEARKAVEKTWKTRWRFIKRIGRRIGRTSGTKRAKKQTTVTMKGR